MSSLVNSTMKVLLVVGIAVLFGFGFLVFSPSLFVNVYLLYALPFLFILFLIILINPEKALIVLFFSRALLDPLLNTTKIGLLGSNIGAGGAINFIVILLFIRLAFENSKLLFSEKKVSKNLILYLLVCLAALIYTPGKGAGVKLWLNLVTYLCMFLFPFYYVHNKFDKQKWIRILLYASILPIIFASVDLLKGGRQYAEAGIRILGTFSHPNILAFYLVLTLALVFYILKTDLLNLSRFKKNALIVYMILLFTLLLSTKTRSAWISCWVFFFAYGILKDRKYLFYCVVVPLLCLLHPAIYSRVIDIITGESVVGYKGVNSLEWRLDLWKSSFPWIKSHVVFGNGLASFLPLSANFYRGGANVPAHNIFVEILFETGIIGLSSYLSIYISLLKSFFKKMIGFKKAVSNEYAIIIAYVIGYLVSSYGDNMLYYLVFNWYFWFFIGIVLKSSQFDDKNLNHNPVV